VAEGTYKPDQGGGKTPGDRTATFQLVNGVALYGGFVGTESSLDERDWQTNETILSGDIGTVGNNSDNSFHVVTGSGTDATAVLDGFTITAGNAELPSPDGGGMYCGNFSGPTIENCTFKGNSANRGGGLFCNWSYFTLTNCTFSGNSANLNGGGIYCLHLSNPTLINCTFSGNSANSSGGGMFSHSSAPILENCNFSGNSSGESGGGMSMGTHYIFTPRLTNCTFSGNSSDKGGGACFYDGSTARLTNCTFSGNTANLNGGGLVCGWETSPVLDRCTFAGNSAPNGSALACDTSTPGHPSTVSLANCILWDDGNQIWNNDSSTITINYSDVQGGWAGTGNIDEDPLFIDPNGLDGIPGTADDEEGYVHLRGYSPCINAGDPGGDYSGQVDIDNQPRVAYGRVDMGADEVFPAAGDFEPDGDVDFVDFAIFANHWLLGE